ncbi:Periplasmic beta-glucosidase [Linum perenne]
MDETEALLLLTLRTGPNRLQRTGPQVLSRRQLVSVTPGGPNGTDQIGLLVADMFYPWAMGSAARFSIPRLVFHGKGFFMLYADEVIQIRRTDMVVSPIRTTILDAIKSSVDRSSTEFIVHNENPTQDFVQSNNFSYGIVVVGEGTYAEYEGDSSNLTIPHSGLTTIDNVCGAMRCVVILITGRPMVIQPWLPKIDALVAAWLPGTEGQGVADVLFGDYWFTGKLARTWFKSVDQLPMNRRGWRRPEEVRTAAGRWRPEVRVKRRRGGFQDLHQFPGLEVLKRDGARRLSRYEDIKRVRGGDLDVLRQPRRQRLRRKPRRRGVCWHRRIGVTYGCGGGGDLTVEMGADGLPNGGKEEEKKCEDGRIEAKAAGGGRGTEEKKEGGS